MLALGLLAVIMRNPAMMEELEGYQDYERHNEALPTPLSKIDPYAYRDRSTVQQQYNRMYLNNSTNSLKNVCPFQFQ